MAGPSNKTGANKTDAKKTGAQKAPAFETAMEELDQIVANMEAGKLSLEDSLVAYKRGAELLTFCRTKLEDAQQQVSVLEEGVLKDFATGGEGSPSSGTGQA